MNSDIFKNFNIGIINLMGFWVPGFLVVFFLILTVFLPVTCMLFEFLRHWLYDHGIYSFGWQEIETFLSGTKFYLMFFATVFAYLFGYMLRLLTPDKLDKISAERIAVGMFEKWLDIDEDSPNDVEYRETSGSSASNNTGEQDSEIDSKADIQTPDNRSETQSLGEKKQQSVSRKELLKRIRSFKNLGFRFLARFSSKKKFYFGLNGKAVIEDMDKKYIEMGEEDGWIFGLPNNDKDDKYPYLKFGDYLRKRGHEKVADAMVVWSTTPHPGEEEKDPKTGLPKAQRSKIIINTYKQKVRNSGSEISNFLDSFEAHIRLLNGTWQIAKTFSKTSLIFGLIFVVVLISEGTSHDTAPYYADLFLLGAILELLTSILLFKARSWIEAEFHYQRLRELTRILTSAYQYRFNDPMLFSSGTLHF